MADARTEVPVGNAEVSAKIVRACRECGAKREIGQDCSGCGLAEAPEVIDLGVISALKSDPLKQLQWNLVGSRLADRRIRKANKAVKELCGSSRYPDGRERYRRPNPDYGNLFD